MVATDNNAVLLSVVLSTYNPDKSRLDRTISGLQYQSLAYRYWELIIVDNNSSIPINVDLSWHPNAKLVKETRQGLTWARLKGFEQALTAVIVMVDDDNILEEHYLQNALRIMQSDNKLGAIGGKSIPLFEKLPPDWLKEFYGSLALRDMGDSEMLASWSEEYPKAAPIGAGMVLRKVALSPYIAGIGTNLMIGDRTGADLSSGGDNDIVIEILKSGWLVGYFPSLSLTHIIPSGRLEPKYLAKLTNNIQKSWVQVLEKHDMNPWPLIAGWTVPLRKLKAWIFYRAFLNKINYIKWRGACGMFDGLAKKNKYE